MSDALKSNITLYTILVVDDTPQNLTLMSNLLGDAYNVKVATRGLQALKIARSYPPPDLILLDIMMPEMNGYEVCWQLKSDLSTKDIAVIFLTAKTATEDEEHGFELGAVDYITKPISPAVVLARVKTHLSLKVGADLLRHKSAFLEQEVVRRTMEISELQDVLVLTMTSLAEVHNEEIGSHSRRTQFYVKALAEALVNHPRFSDYLNDNTIDILFKSAPLHDIGKVGIPASILLKAGELKPKEFEVMKTHATIGRDVIENAEKKLGYTVPFLQCTKEMVYSHHERWDGSGYPQGLVGDDIPISARLMALADVYDTLISPCHYKAAVSHDEAISLIAEGRETLFDPDIVDALVSIQKEYQAIALRYAGD